MRVLLILLLIADSAYAGSLSAIDPDAHYPEGPVWRDGQLFYVDYSAGNIKRWDGTRATIFWHRDGCGASGLIDFHGYWLIACYDDNSIVEVDATGRQVRVSRADSRGRPFTGPNDFAADGHGGIYFSASGVYDSKAPISGAVLHMAADGKLITEVANTLHYPNGLTLAADGEHLLVAEMLAGRILTFPIGTGGTLGPRSVWARLQELAPPTPAEDAYNGPDGYLLSAQTKNSYARSMSRLASSPIWRLERLARERCSSPALSISGKRRTKAWSTAGGPEHGLSRLNDGRSSGARCSCGCTARRHHAFECDRAAAPVRRSARDGR